MAGRSDGALADAMRAIAPPGVLTDCRPIQAGDETHLTPAELRTIPARFVDRLAASGAARLVARGLLAQCGVAQADILRDVSGAPVWPREAMGSLAHDDAVAVAAVALLACGVSPGIDVEPALPLPDELLELVLTPADRLGGLAPALAGRLLFSAKEAVYKSVYPLDGVVLNYDDIAVDFAAGLARTTTGRIARFAWIAAPRIVTLAVTPVPAAARR